MDTFVELLLDSSRDSQIAGIPIPMNFIPILGIGWNNTLVEIFIPTPNVPRNHANENPIPFLCPMAISVR